MKAYLAIFRIRFIYSLQYRVAAFAGMMTQFAWAFIEILAFTAFYRVNPSGFPMEFSQTITYIWLNEAFLVLFSGLLTASEITDAIESGSIAYELIRPMDLYGRWVSQFIASRLAGVGLRCVPILIVAFIVPEPYRLSLPSNIESFILFLLTTVLAVGVIATLSMLIYVTVFYTLSFRGTRLVFGNIIIFLSGALIPLPFFPESIRAVIELLPFAAMHNIPFRIYSGNIVGAGALRGILLQIFWLIALWITGRLVMNHALKRVVVQGG